MRNSLYFLAASMVVAVAPLQAQPLEPSSAHVPSPEAVASCTAEVNTRYAALNPQDKKRLTLAEMIKTCSINSSMVAFANAQNKAITNDQRDHAAAIAEYEADKAAQVRQVQQEQTDYENAQAQWREDVAACEQGDESKCAPPTQAD